MECDRASQAAYSSLGISTHALTWSATEGVLLADEFFPFQLTHSRGVRPFAFCFQLFFFHFNSRTHVECDVLGKNAADIDSISTHALTWSATLNGSLMLMANIFQLTHSRGVRRICRTGAAWLYKFQLTHSRGVRQ